MQIKTRAFDSFCFLLVLFAALTIVPSGYAGSQSSRKKPLIDAIDGKGAILLVHGQNGQTGQKKQEVAVGQELNSGDKIKTDENSSASILYPDGSRIIIAANSEFQIEAQVESTQWNRLTHGSVRGIVQKLSIPVAKKPKFVVRTKAAVLGVRGTDFIMSMNAADQVAQINTLEGTVEVAPNQVSLMSGKGTAVSEGQFLQGSNSGLSSIQTFDKQEFLKSFNSSLSPGSSPTSGGSASSTGTGTGPTSPAAPIAEAPVYAAPPTSFPAPTKFPPPAPPASPKGEEPKKEQQAQIKREEPSRSIRLLAFQASVFFAQLPDSSSVRALSAAWTPSIPVPFISFLTVRGHLGGEFGQQGSLSSSFLIYDLQAYLVVSLLDPIFIEGGFGMQSWKNPYSFDASLVTVNLGFRIKLWLLDHIFVGYQTANTHPSLNEYKAGVGITLF